MVFPSSKFQSLSVRPPTPPKELHDTEKDADEVLDFLNDPFGTKEPVAKVKVAKALLNTPQSSPSSASAIPSSGTRSSSKKKRVIFEAEPCATNGNGTPLQSYIPLLSSPLRPLPQTRVSKPLKSILKPSDATSTPPPADEGTPAHKFESFAEMLESIMKQLASQTRSARFDAYNSLHRTMQAYEKIPDIQALVDKMGLLTQFIERDMHAVGINGTGVDSQLIGLTLKFLMALIRIPEVRPVLPDEFCAFVIDRIIQVAANTTLPKLVINAHLALLMQQNFRPRTMTPARVERILDALDTIEDRVKGLSVLAYRVRIFRKLIQQRPEIMSKHTERWFKHTAKASLSVQKDINQSALDTIVSAAKAFGHDGQVTKSVLIVMNRVKSDGYTVTHGMVNALEDMLRTDHAVMAPQIWSAITSLLSGCLEKSQFPALLEWLKVFQMFFNSENDAVRMHANIALGFLVYAIQLKENTTPAWPKMLIQIPQTQFNNQRGQSKKNERHAATSAYFALLYHAFGPTATHKQLERFWTEFVADFWIPLVRPSSAASPSSPKHAFAACRVVSALFNGARKPCDGQRTLDLRPQTMLQLEDLPSLDPKWIRKSLPSILQFVEILVDTTPWIADDCKDEPARNMWLSLLDSLNTASSQEVMASTESKDAMAHLVNFLRRVWDGHAAQLALSQQKEDSWADKFCFLLETVVEKLGAVHFSDKCLARNGHDVFEAATPSHRPRQQQHGPRTSPLLYFIDLLANQSEGKLSDSFRLRALKVLIEPCFVAQNTRLSGLELLYDCSMLVDASRQTSLSDTFWFATANLTTDCLKNAPSDLKERGSRQFGKEYDIVVEIMFLGSAYLYEKSVGERLLACFVEAVKREAGDGAAVLAVVEKVSERVLKRTGTETQVASLSFLVILLNNLPTTMARRIIEQGRRVLWPSSSNQGRNADLDPYIHFYDVVVSSGSAAYQRLDGESASITSKFLEALATSIRQCPLHLLAVYLRKIQDMVCLWIEDDHKKLQQKITWIKAVYNSVMQLWKEVCAAMYKLPRNNPQILVHLEPLITSGFVSQRRGIVELSIGSWNATFGREEKLHYPPRLGEALRQVRRVAELSLPSLEVREHENETTPSFYNSDSNPEDESEPRKRTPRVKETPHKVVKSSQMTRSKSQSPVAPLTKSKKLTPGRISKVRLRHENSQIQFEPIISSSSNPNDQESQVLTERQREVYERQMRSLNVYTDIRTSSPQPQPVVLGRSPLGLHSDASGAEDSVMETSRTPLRNVRALGPMDVFVGSSPTPQARSRTQEVASDQTSVATPTAVRTVRLAHDGMEDFGSSPPHFEKNAPPSFANIRSGDELQNIGDKIGDNEQSEMPSTSFDDGTTIDEDAFLTGTPDRAPDEADEEVSTDTETSDVPTSTIDLQLTAQIDADMQAQQHAAAGKGLGVTTLISEQLPNEPNAGTETEVEDTEADLPTAIDSIQFETETSGTSRVGDSFSSQGAEAENSQARSLRRSQRHSFRPSPQLVNAKKRKFAGRSPGRPRKNKAESDQDNIVAATPIAEPISGGKSKAKTTDDAVVVPDTARTRGVRRSASLLSQMETHSTEDVADTPAPKRARRSADRDTSEAKHNTPSNSQQSNVKRLSHVQVTPKHSEAQSLVRNPPTAVEESSVQQPIIEPAVEAALVDEHNVKVPRQLTDATSAAGQVQESQSQQANSMATPSRSFAKRVILTPRSILNQLKNLKEALFGAPRLAFSRQEEREADDFLFDIRRELHAAGRRREGE